MPPLLNSTSYPSLLLLQSRPRLHIPSLINPRRPPLRELNPKRKKRSSAASSLSDNGHGTPSDIRPTFTRNKRLLCPPLLGLHPSPNTPRQCALLVPVLLTRHSNHSPRTHSMLRFRLLQPNRPVLDPSTRTHTAMQLLPTAPARTMVIPALPLGAFVDQSAKAE